MSTQYENPWFRVVREDGFHWMVEDGAHNGAAVLAIVDEREVVLVQTRRPAQGHREALEIPRGYGEPGETSLACACRELREETGYQARPEQLTRLGHYQPNSAILASSVELYLARLSASDQVGGHDGEVTGVILLPLETLRQRLLAGKLSDGFTLAALAHYYAAQL